MASPMQSVRSRLSGETWVERGAAGAAAGLVGGVAMGVLLQFGTDLLPIIGGVAGRATLVRGWLVHLTVSAVYGLAFGVFLSFPFIRDVADTVGACVFLGVIHASALGLFTVGVVLQLATAVFGLSSDPLSALLFPGPGAGSLVAAGVFGLSHLLYGLVLGALYGVLRGIGSR